MRSDSEAKAVSEAHCSKFSLKLLSLILLPSSFLYSGRVYAAEGGVGLVPAVPRAKS